MALTIGAQPAAIENAAQVEAMQREAAQHFDQARWSEGIAALEAAHRRYAHPIFLFQIAAAYHAWGDHCAESLEAFERFEAACERCEHRAKALRFRETVEKRCRPTLRVDSTPSNASVRIGPSWVGRTPLTTRVAPGTHRVVVRSTTHGAAERTVTLAPGQEERVTFELVVATVPPPAPPPAPPSAPATLRLVGVEDATAVLIDGRPASIAGGGVVEVAPGDRVVMVKRGEDTERRVVAATPGETTEVVFDRVVADGAWVARPVAVWTAAGVASAALATGVVFGVRAQTGVSELESARGSGTATREAIEELRGDIRTNAVVSNVAYGTALIAGLATIYFLVRPGDEPEPEASTVGVAFLPNLPKGAAIAGRF